MNREFKIYSSPLPFPFNFVTHTWVVTILPSGETHRYEIHMFKNKNKKLGYLHIDNEIPEVGLEKIVFNKNFKFQGKLLYKTSGGEGSLAQKIVEFTNNNITTYKYMFKYRHLWGPNCNSFTKWILSHFPEINVKYPWNAIGKNFKFK